MSLSTVFCLTCSTMSSSISKPVGGKRKRAGGCRANVQIPKGDILVDSSKKEWIILNSIGSGGFGEIYTAASAQYPDKQNFVIKIEPSENGPLFCEKTVYIRIGKKEDIKAYMKSKGLKSLGMPQFYGSGIHSAHGKKFRFLVMERYGKDLSSIFVEDNKKIPPATVYKIAIQVLDVLEYIHSKGYVHADIKGANLLLGRTKETENQVYLVDFGLAARYTTQYKPDPRRAHNGTIEYTSVDGHEGIVTRRGDIEVLGYNLLQWLSSSLPWEGLRDVHEVQSKKNKYMKDYTVLMQTCFKKQNIPKPIEKYFRYVSKMDPLAEPDYDMLRKIMRDEIVKIGDTSNKLDFSCIKSNSASVKSSVPAKVRKLNNRNGRNVTSGSSKVKLDVTVNIPDSSNSSSDDDDNSEDQDEDDYISGTPEKSPKNKKSWKDCPSVVSCAQLLLKDDKSLRRSKRNK